MADQAFPDGDLAHPDRPNAYGPVQYPIRSRMMRLRRFENDAPQGQDSDGPADASEASGF